MRRDLKGSDRLVLLALTSIGVLLAVFYLWRIAVGTWVMYDRTYYYGLYATFLPLAFMLYPWRKSAATHKVPFYDYLLVLLCVGIFGYFSAIGFKISLEGWSFWAPGYGTVLGFVALLLLLEAARRTTGLLFLGIVLAFLLFPMYTGFLPSFLKGVSFDFWSVMRINALGSDSICGLPVRVVGTQLLGYFVFAAVMLSTGAGKFFLDFATSLMGRGRGGPAKVGVVSSGFFGSFSGSVMANVITTGAVTIPAMKRIGFPSKIAGAVEACASTGGVLMPPVMGATAFIMAAFLGIPYYSVAIAAAVPSVLYYFSLYVGVDCHAVRFGLKGLPKEECPRLIDTLKQGWIYIFAFAMLIFMLFYLKWVAYAPFYTSAALVVLSMLRKSTRLSLAGLRDVVVEIGRQLASLIPGMGAVGILIAAFAMTGVGHAFAREMIDLAGGNLALLVGLGALTSFILGMGMTVTACYIFLAITLAPALEGLGLDVLGIHLFLLYYGMLSYITPPVAFGAYAASVIAGEKYMKVGVESVRLGAVLFVLPFAFLFNEALILHGSVWSIAFWIPANIFGTWVLVCGLTGHLHGAASLRWFHRLLLVTGGFLIIVPTASTTYAGFAVAAVVVLERYISGRRHGLSRSPA